MSTNFGALCTDFYMNYKLGVKMELPLGRETVLHLFDRVRGSEPKMNRLLRYGEEFSLESSRRDGEYQWISMSKKAVRTGHVNPESLDAGSKLHELILEICPYYLSISALEVDCQELVFGFDMECRANQNEVVYEALIADSPLASLFDDADMKMLDIQPVFGVGLSKKCDVQAFFEVKTRTSVSEIRKDRFRNEVISVYLTIRRRGSVDDISQLPVVFGQLRGHAERLAQEKVVPELVLPISQAIANNNVR